MTYRYHAGDHADATRPMLHTNDPQEALDEAHAIADAGGRPTIYVELSATETARRARAQQEGAR